MLVGLVHTIAHLVETAILTPSNRLELDLNGKTIEVFVGESKTSFFVHRSVFVKNSGFARSALSDGWNATNVNLPDCNPERFQKYMHYLYRDRLPSAPPGTSGSGGEDGFEWTAELFNHYYMGDFLQDFRYCNRIMDTIGQQTIHLWPGNSVEDIYQSTAPKSTLRRWIADYHVWRGKGKTAVLFYHIHDFVVDITDAFIKKEQETDATPYRLRSPWSRDRCRYHIHVDDSKREACKGGEEDA